MNLDDEASLSSEQLPWPRFGDQLFGPDDDWYNNAFVSTCLDGLDLYASGYLEAAQIVVEAIVSSRRSPDAVVYPIGFLYRHYLELRLKTIIDQGKKLLNRRPGFPETHDLDLLWKTARKIIEEIYWKDPKETVEAVHESMVQFCDLDKDSYAFRYLTDKSGKIRYLAGLKLLNVRQLSEVMGRISRFLESVSEGIAENLRIMQENQEHD